MEKKYYQNEYQWKSRLGAISKERRYRAFSRFRKAGLPIPIAKEASEHFLDAQRIRKEFGLVNPKHHVTLREAAGMLQVLSAFNDNQHITRGLAALVPMSERFFLEKYAQYRFQENNSIPKSPEEKLALADYLAALLIEEIAAGGMLTEKVKEYFPELERVGYGKKLKYGILPVVKRHPWIGAGVFHARAIFEQYRSSNPKKGEVPLPVQRKIVGLFIDDIFGNFDELRAFSKKVVQGPQFLSSDDLDLLTTDYGYVARMGKLHGLDRRKALDTFREAIRGRKLAEFIARDISRYAYPKFTISFDPKKGFSVSVGETRRPLKKPKQVQFDIAICNFLRNPKNHQFLYRLMSAPYRH